MTSPAGPTPGRPGPGVPGAGGTTRSGTRRAVVVHGYDAAPGRHWFPWLREELVARGWEVDVLALPEPGAPSAQAWERAVADATGDLDEQTHLVAHSLGCVTVLRHLASRQAPWRLGALVLAAGFTGPLPALPLLDDHLAAGVDDVALRRVVARTRRRLLVRSDDDPMVPATATDALAARLDAPVAVVPGGGHLMDSDGVLALPPVLAALLGSLPEPTVSQQATAARPAR